MSHATADAMTELLTPPPLADECVISISTTRRYSAASPLRYPGGKAALAGFFKGLIDDLGIQSPRYVEPFAGGVGAGLALLVDDAVASIVINDVDPAVFSFWNSVVNDTQSFLDLVVDTPVTLDEWHLQRDTYRRADRRDRLALGFAFFYLNRTNRSGILNAGVIGGQAQAGKYLIGARYYRDELVRRIEAIGALRDRIAVSDEDGGSLIESLAGDPGAFFYIDPPYVRMGDSLYLNAFSLEDHANLSETINGASQSHWVLTYDISDYVRELYSGRYIREFELQYSASRAGIARELLISSLSVEAVLRAREGR